MSKCTPSFFSTLAMTLSSEGDDSIRQRLMELVEKILLSQEGSCGSSKNRTLGAAEMFANFHRLSLFGIDVVSTMLSRLFLLAKERMMATDSDQSPLSVTIESICKISKTLSSALDGDTRTWLSTELKNFTKISPEAPTRVLGSRLRFMVEDTYNLLDGSLADHSSRLSLIPLGRTNQEGGFLADILSRTDPPESKKGEPWSPRRPLPSGDSTAAALFCPRAKQESRSGGGYRWRNRPGKDWCWEREWRRGPRKSEAAVAASLGISKLEALCGRSGSFSAQDARWDMCKDSLASVQQCCSESPNKPASCSMDVRSQVVDRDDCFGCSDGVVENVESPISFPTTDPLTPAAEKGDCTDVAEKHLAHILSKLSGLWDALSDVLPLSSSNGSGSQVIGEAGTSSEGSSSRPKASCDACKTTCCSGSGSDSGELVTTESLSCDLLELTCRVSEGSCEVTFGLDVDGTACGANAVSCDVSEKSRGKIDGAYGSFEVDLIPIASSSDTDDRLCDAHAAGLVDEGTQDFEEGSCEAGTVHDFACTCSISQGSCGSSEEVVPYEENKCAVFREDMSSRAEDAAGMRIESDVKCGADEPLSTQPAAETEGHGDARVQEALQKARLLRGMLMIGASGVPCNHDSNRANNEDGSQVCDCYGCGCRRICGARDDSAHNDMDCSEGERSWSVGAVRRLCLQNLRNVDKVCSLDLVCEESLTTGGINSLPPTERCAARVMTATAVVVHTLPHLLCEYHLTLQELSHLTEIDTSETLPFSGEEYVRQGARWLMRMDRLYPSMAYRLFGFVTWHGFATEFCSLHEHRTGEIDY
eukprot:Rmarinus@m.10884